jgi:hypothetical protein
MFWATMSSTNGGTYGDGNSGRANMGGVWSPQPRPNEEVMMRFQGGSVLVELLLLIAVVALIILGLVWVVRQTIYESRIHRQCLEMGYPDIRCVGRDCYCVRIEEGQEVVISVTLNARVRR